MALESRISWFWLLFCRFHPSPEAIHLSHGVYTVWSSIGCPPADAVIKVSHSRVLYSSGFCPISSAGFGSSFFGVFRHRFSLAIGAAAGA